MPGEVRAVGTVVEALEVGKTGADPSPVKCECEGVLLSARARRTCLAVVHRRLGSRYFTPIHRWIGWRTAIDVVSRIPSQGFMCGGPCCLWVPLSVAVVPAGSSGQRRAERKGASPTCRFGVRTSAVASAGWFVMTAVSRPRAEWSASGPALGSGPSRGQGGEARRRTPRRCRRRSRQLDRRPRASRTSSTLAPGCPR